MRPASVLVVLAGLTAAACGSAPKTDLRLPPAFEAPASTAAAQPIAQPVALDRWWTVFDDPALTLLVDQALAANPDARSAAARLREARASRDDALFGFLPQGDLSGSGRRTHNRQVAGTAINIPGFSTRGISDAYAANFDVSWELDVFGRVFAANRVARAEVEAARMDLEGTRASLPSQLLGRRPDVRQAEARLRSALGQRDVARMAFLPTFTLKPGAGWSKQSQPGYSSETVSWVLGGTVTQPVLAIPQLLARLRVQNARAEQAAANYEKTVQTAFGEAEAALVRLDADRRRVALLTDGEHRAARAYQAAQLGYGRGLTDLQTALSAEQTWRAARTQLTSAQVQAVRRAVQAYKALGGGWSGAGAA
jgi:outer membrane protein TolC